MTTLEALTKKYNRLTTYRMISGPLATLCYIAYAYNVWAPTSSGLKDDFAFGISLLAAIISSGGYIKFTADQKKLLAEMYKK